MYLRISILESAKPFLIFSVLVLCLLPRAAQGEKGAMDQLLEIFQSKGVITSEEVEVVRQALEKEQARMVERELELDDREKALRLREEELAARERAARESLGPPAPEEPRETKSASAPEAESTEASQEPVEEGGQRLFARYGNGFCLEAADGDGPNLCIGGLLQVDYRYFDYDMYFPSGAEADDPAKNKFDLRRARLILGGKASERLDYEFEYEFEGAGSRRLMDAYMEGHLFPWVSLRLGQFKEPFGFTHSNKDKDLFFAERPMGYSFTPQRDVGVMARGSLFEDRINYGVGFFNGDGLDDASGGNVDDPQWTGRLVLAPFKGLGFSFLENFQFGGSFNYAEIDTANVEIHVKTAGMTPFFDVASRAKFNIIREVDDLSRVGAEFAWTYGPLALAGEYYRSYYEDVRTSSSQFDIELQDYYLALVCMLTGETISLGKGIYHSVEPEKSVWDGGMGAVALGLRYDHFITDEAVYDYLIVEGISAREAKAYTIALNWYLDPHLRLTLDGTRTRFDKAILIYRDASTGTAAYSDREDVITGRLQLQF